MGNGGGGGAAEGGEHGITLSLPGDPFSLLPACLPAPPAYPHALPCCPALPSLACRQATGGRSDHANRHPTDAHQDIGSGLLQQQKQQPGPND